MDNLRKSFLVKGNSIIGAVGDKNFSTLHIGCITPYLGTKDNIPNGYLLADGASYKTTDYPELFNIIGYTYGGSDDTFNVPNLCDGRFLEGSDTSGEYVEAGLPNITGGWMPSVPVNYQNYATGAVAAEIKSSGLVSSSGTQAAIGAGFKIDASKSSAVYGNSDTVQPKSLRVLYIIKAFHTNEGVDSKNEVSDPIIEYVEGEIAKVETDMDKVVKYPDWSNQQTISQTEITVDQDVYIELNQLTNNPIEALKINGKNVSVSDTENGLYSTRFSGYVKKGSFVSYPYLTNANIVRVFPLV